jgi:predicted ATPase/class 3 adenylate cyclase/DNA-binding XRE family transcriptional regulator/catechol 2,3-dioxygenase-like lactoylglutathione lyase family enzyme
MTADDSATFGAVLRRWRSAAGLTQEELAERAGLSRRGINDLERGARLLPRRDTVALLADALRLQGDDRSAFFATARRQTPLTNPSPLPAIPGVPVEAAEPVAPAGTSLLDPVALPEGTITFLFTDIEGSTLLLQQLGAVYAQALGEHQALLRAAFAAHGGTEVDTQGDAFFVAFPTAPQALEAAADATRALAEHAWPERATVRVRIGLHTGTPQRVGDHYVGLDVHRGARIAAAGHGGQVLLSQATRALVEQNLPEGVTLRELGAHRLKDLQQPEPITQVVLADLPASFPPLKTLDTHQHNLPLQPTPMLDREQALAALTALLRRDEVRLVTVTGPGGIGKTRLAVQVAAELVDSFADGVWLVRLSRLIDPGLVVPTIAQTLGLKETGREPIADLLHAYVAEKCLLLVLDNFEQVIGAAPEVAALLEASRGLRILVTSRLPLHLRGEREYPLVPLPLPQPGNVLPEELSQYAAVALFIERAQAARPNFAVTSANAPAIAEICTRLDGLPLAIELAASRVKVLLPEALLSRLSTGLKLLTGGARDLDERQQTMWATIAWSEALLAPEERILFRRLSVFAGGCTLDATEVVCIVPKEAAPLELDLLDGFSALVDHSLVQQREEDGEPRFGMLQVIREYAREQLKGSGEEQALRRAHAEYFLELAERARRQETGPETVTWRDRLEREHDNLRAALGWAREQGEVELGLRLAVALTWFWVRRGYLREGRAWLEGLLALAAGEAEAARAPRLAVVRAKALLNAGVFALIMGAYATAEIQLEQARALAQVAGDPRTARQALTNLGRVASDQGDLERAKAFYTEGLTLAREPGDRREIVALLTNLGHVASRQGDLERAKAFYTEGLTLARELGDRDQMALSLNNLGDVAWKQGELSQAEGLMRESLMAYRELGDPRRCALVLESLAETAGAAGQGERAAHLLGAATALRERLGTPLTASSQADVEQAVAEARAALGEEAWAAAFAAGKALSLEQAIAEALETA